MVLNFKDKRIRGIFEQYVDDILHKRREGFLDREQEEKISLLENEIRSVIDKYQNPHFQKIISQAIGESAYRASEVYEKSRKLYDSTLEFKDHDDGNSGFELNDGLNDFSDEYILERASETAKSINENLENFEYVKIKNRKLFVRFVSKAAIYSPQKCKHIENVGFILESEEKLEEVVDKLEEIEKSLKYSEIRDLCIDSLEDSFKERKIEFSNNYNLFRSIIEGSSYPINSRFVGKICRTFNNDEKELALKLAGDVSRLYDDEISGFVCSAICSYRGSNVPMFINRIEEISNSGNLRDIFGLDEEN
jgi:hypothetical protein